MAAAWRRGETPTLDQGLIDALAATLRDADADPAFAAEALALPGEAFLADQMAVADVDAIHAVRDAARAAIGRALRDELRATYERLTDTGAVQHRRRRDRPAFAAQYLPRLSRGGRRCRRDRAGEGAVRCRDRT